VRSGQLRYRTAVGCWSKARPAVPVTAVMSQDLSPHSLSRFWPGLYLEGANSRNAIYERRGKPYLPLHTNPERKKR